jgi:hypothetical protein
VTEREWTDKDGMKRKSMDVRVSEVALQGKRDARQEDAPRKPAPKRDEAFEDDSIPF